MLKKNKPKDNCRNHSLLTTFINLEASYIVNMSLQN